MSDRMRPVSPVPGSAFEPTGNPLQDGVGAAAWAEDRADRCDLTVHGLPKIVPMSIAPGFHVHHRDPDPRGMTVVGADGVAAGIVSELWVDRSEPQLRYLSVTLSDGSGEVLLPIGYAKVDRRRRRVRVKALMGSQISGVPRPKALDRITLLEEDRVVAYYAGGYRYAEPSRNEPFL